MNPDILEDTTATPVYVDVLPGVVRDLSVETAGLAVITPEISFADGISDDLARVANFVAAHGVGSVGGASMPFAYVATTLGAAVAVAWLGGRVLDAVGIKGDVALAYAGVASPLVLEVMQKRSQART